MKVVVFTSNNARIVHTEDLAPYQNNPNCVIEPDLEHLHGVPPHFWALRNGSIVAMSEEEQKERLSEHSQMGVDNDVSRVLNPPPPKPAPPPKPKLTWWQRNYDTVLAWLVSCLIILSVYLASHS